MKEQIERDVSRILKDKHGISHRIKVSDVITVGLNRTCSIDIGRDWVFNHVTYESLEGAVFKYKPEPIADMMAIKIRRLMALKKQS
ncbi:hypothetical protein LMH73_009100 [Vibrio splendidus]|nr:hypothetical protein [Vibrio splendidus]MCC4880319.1 hypothetical protein [Vibrio splendidus]